ncbi:MAG: hypothetical protein RLZZ568_763 [Cyanobacteriota bacterium]
MVLADSSHWVTLQQQQQFFAAGQTHSYEFRRQCLLKLKAAVLAYQAKIIAALSTDLGKPEFEARFEIISVVNEINFALKHLKQWLKPKKVALSLMQQPGTAFQKPDPLGQVLIIGPWNFPFSLVVQPLVGAIAAGNCAILKPSEMAPATATITAQLIQTTFDAAHVAAITGGVETSQNLLKEKFDHIFFTGGTVIGKIVMAAAAQHLTPVTLELGGKSPCLVTDNIDLRETAKRITWGKFLNAGQVCIAPDYLLVPASRQDALLQAMKECIRDYYGDNPQTSAHYGRLVNDRQWQRVAQLMAQGEIYCGGQLDQRDRYIAPTILINPDRQGTLMTEEIFGPLLPVIPYQTLEEAIAFVNAKPKPLALYLFSRDAEQQRQVLSRTTAGGVCINDTVMQVAVDTLPFGGVGPSGMGSYHGKASFDTFSHYKSVLKKGFRFDFNWRYPPYTEKNLAIMRRLLKQ